MLVRAHRASMPEPEEMLDRGAQPERVHRQGFDDTVWFRLDIGRRQNADPRWVLPLICRRGHITKNEVGAIRIGPNETFFQVPRGIADRFAHAASKSMSEDDPTTIVPSPDGPPQGAHARSGGGGQRGGPNRPQGQGSAPRHLPRQACGRPARAAARVSGNRLLPGSDDA